MYIFLIFRIFAPWSLHREINACKAEIPRSTLVGRQQIPRYDDIYVAYTLAQLYIRHRINDRRRSHRWCLSQWESGYSTYEHGRETKWNKECWLEYVNDQRM